MSRGTGARVSHAGGVVGFKANPHTMFRDELLNISCPVCGATKGNRCRDRFGVIITNIHSDRAVKLAAAKEQQ